MLGTEPSATEASHQISSEPGSRAGQYSLRRVGLATAPASELSDWQAYFQLGDFHLPTDDPEWLQGFFQGQIENLSGYLLYQSGALSGVAPFLRKDWPLRCHLGEIRVAQLPLRRLRLLGGKLNFPETEAAYDILFSELIASEKAIDVISLHEVPIDSFLWNYLKSSRFIRREFRRYIPGAPSPHELLRFRGTFDDYMKKFSAKHRSELRRQVRRIREGALGEMRFVRYTKPEEVEPFLEPAVEVSKKTFQWNLHKRGLYATDLIRQRLQFAAQHGWFRSYLLFCNNVPCAFRAGFQYRGRYLPLEIGFDPALSKHSVGTVLQLLVIEEMFTHDTPELIDFGGYGGWKHTLATERYLESEVLLFRPGAYTRFVQEAHRACEFATKKLSRAFERLQLKRAIKKMIRNWSNKS